jgi:hypothetical protein
MQPLVGLMIASSTTVDTLESMSLETVTGASLASWWQGLRCRQKGAVAGEVTTDAYLGGLVATSLITMSRRPLLGLGIATGGLLVSETGITRTVPQGIIERACADK